MKLLQRDGSLTTIHHVDDGTKFISEASRNDVKEIFMFNWGSK